VNKYALTLSLIFSFLFTLSSVSYASNLIRGDGITQQTDCFSRIFSDYESWRGFMERKFKRKSQSEEKLLKALTRFDSMFGSEKFNHYKNNLSCINFSYLVDGNKVRGFMIKPKLSTKKLPVLIYNRGGNGNFGGVVFGSMIHNLFPIAEEGFVIIGSQYRGTFMDGSPVRDEFGGKDVDDVTALLKYIPDIEGADPDRVGMYGASRGGMQTFLALKKSPNIKAVATIAGNSDLLKGLTYRPEMERVHRNRIPDYEQNKEAELTKRSVLKWVDQLASNVPILLLHGTNDKRVSVNHSIDLATALSTHNIPHKLVLYPEDNHGLIKNKAKANKELVNWFNLYL